MGMRVWIIARWLVLHGGALLLACHAAGAKETCEGSPTRFDYRSVDLAAPANDNGFSLDLTRKIHWRGHAGLKLETCGPDDPLICFHSAALAFAIPKKTPATGASWTHEDQTFVAQGEFELGLLGLRLPVMAIETADGRQAFLYSTTNGLVGIGIGEEAAGRTWFWSRSLPGYPLSKCGS